MQSPQAKDWVCLFYESFESQNWVNRQMTINFQNKFTFGTNSSDRQFGFRSKLSYFKVSFPEIRYLISLLYQKRMFDFVWAADQHDV